jgi:hypothetical protein
MPSISSKSRIRYVLYRSYVLLARPPITEQIPDELTIGKAQRLDREAHEPPALPLSYSAAARSLSSVMESSNRSEIGNAAWTCWP